MEGREAVCTHLSCDLGKEQARAELTVNKLLLVFAVLWLRNWSQRFPFPTPPVRRGQALRMTSGGRFWQWVTESQNSNVGPH